jgi:hypothetical protein
MTDATQWIEHYRRHWDRRLDRLEATIDRKKRTST